MESTIKWVAENWTTVVGTAGSVVMGASILVKAIAPRGVKMRVIGNVLSSF